MCFLRSAASTAPAQGVTNTTQTARLLPFEMSDPVLVKSSKSVNGFSLQGSTHSS